MTTPRRGDYVHLPQDRLGVVVGFKSAPAMVRPSGHVGESVVAVVEDATRGTRSEQALAALRRADPLVVVFRLGPEALVLGRP